MLSFIRTELSTLRPLLLVLVAAAIGFCVSAIYKSGFEQGVLEAFHDQDVITQAEVNLRVKEMEAGRNPPAGMSSQPHGHPDNAD